MIDKNAASNEFSFEDAGRSPGDAQYLTFFLGGQEYGVDILKVQGIQGWGDYTILPNTPEYLLGVINLRGAIVPIIDLRLRFSLGEPTYNDVTVVIVVKIAYGDTEKVIGLVVDNVSEVYNIDNSSMNIPPDFGSNVDVTYLSGLAMVDKTLVIMIDVDKLISESVLENLPEA